MSPYNNISQDVFIDVYACLFVESFRESQEWSLARDVQDVRVVSMMSRA